MKDILDKHYSRLAREYDQLLYYSDHFVRTLTSKMLEKLRFRLDDTFVDLGAGTAMYTLDILKQVPLVKPVIAVDPYPEMLAKIPADAPIERVVMNALEFSRRDARYDKILIKEAVHHTPERAELFANLYQRLNPDGVLLLVHVPPEVNYPLFDKALERCRRWHADPDELTSQLETAGFRVERDEVDYEHVLPKEHYFKMVERCYMSVLTSFSESELQEGLQEMREKYADQEVLGFVDHFDFLTAVRA